MSPSCSLRAAINADPDMPWTAGAYELWEGKTRRDTLHRYGTK